MPRIQLETKINCTDIRRVFDLCRSIDLHIASMKHTNEKAIAGTASGLIGLGETVTWRAKHFGFYQTLTSKITDVESPTFFADEQEKGIFHSFRHEHYLSQENDEVTVIIKDDGKGFDLKEVSLGNGLSNIETRVASIDGHVFIQSEKDHGTEVKIVLSR